MRSTPMLAVLAAFASISLGATSANAQAAPAPAAKPAAAAPAGAPPATVVYVVSPPAADPNAPRTANNALSIEFLGPGLFYSLNFDHAFGDVAARVGISYLSLSASSGSSEAHAGFLLIPLTVSYLGIGSKKHIFEVGGGVTILNVGAGASTLGVENTSSSGSQTTAFGHLILGYRLQPPDGGFFLRTGLSPLIGSGFFLPWPYVGLGATF